VHCLLYVSMRSNIPSSSFIVPIRMEQ
jgi:hypothetical protein